MKIIKTPTGFKVSAKGKVINDEAKAADLFAGMTKGEARQLRKQLREQELSRFARVARKAA